ncbi:hypothetical protein ILUMI_09782 [Ignelater luminosus]|uniref:Angiotensin-converting enzyme n=1 Tax=Ignelater luminosus TaxID=2038154 RepID=A0A8K0CZ37_IGNLU|nr:hypothetical protein ILUMI_09782 [Ignelater luminosus]
MISVLSFPTFLFEVLLWCNIYATDDLIPDQELSATSLLETLNARGTLRTQLQVLAEWNYKTNISEETLKKQLEVSKQIAKENKEDWLQAIKYNWRSFKDPTLRRRFMKYSILGASALPEDKYVALQKIVDDMQAIYSTSKICDFKNPNKCDLSLEPEIVEIMTNSRDPEELKHVWVEWRNKNKVVKDMYKKYVELSNEVARLNNFTDNVQYWLFGYEDSKFRVKIAHVWEDIEPLYLQLHAYVRFKLREFYGENVVMEKGPIPAHLLGNMWAQSWISVLNFTLPYPEQQALDVTKELLKQGYTAKRIFKLAESFFVSLNLSAMTPLFWKKSVLEKPTDGREIVCHASAWDFFDGKDYRIKQCTTIDEKSLKTAHHEMGHIQYYMQYKDQPYIFRDGANPGFHEAVGDVMILSVSSTKHLKRIGLMSRKQPDNDDLELNNLYKIALEKVAFLPYSYVMDLWRWSVFERKTTPKNYNCKWWHYRNTIQGIEPPVNRNEDDFDPAAKYHTVADVSYLRYFVSTVIQFQFHLAACRIAGKYDPNDPQKPLHKCDIYKNKKAGNAIGKMLRMGSSRPWRDAMEVLTGERKINASGLLTYFEPLRKWLENENRKNNVYVGWEKPRTKCIKKGSQRRNLLKKYLNK